MMARVFESTWMTYTVGVVFIAIVISFGLQALGVDATVAQIISWCWLLFASLVKHQRSSVKRRAAG